MLIQVCDNCLKQGKVNTDVSFKCGWFGSGISQISLCKGCKDISFDNPEQQLTFMKEVERKVHDMRILARKWSRPPVKKSVNVRKEKVKNDLHS